jgi:hypothetical protein
MYLPPHYLAMTFIKVRRLLRYSICELLRLEAGSWGRREFGKPEQSDGPPLEAASKQRMAKIVTD